MVLSLRSSMLIRGLLLFALATTFALFTSDHPPLQWHEVAAQAVILSENHLEDKSAPQTPRDVSAAFASADNVRVTQITGGPDSNMLSYYDVNLYSAFADRLIYNSTDEIKAKAGKKGNAVWKVVSTKTDGTGAETLVTRASPSISVDRADLSYDGRFVSYIRNNTQPEKGWDLYGFRLAKSGREEELRVTRKQFPVDLTPKIKTSPAVFDKKTGKYLIAFSINQTLYVIRQDGTAPNGRREPQVIPLTDTEKDASFHRIRLNPRFSNLIMYRRNPLNSKATDGASKNLWVIDWVASSPQSILWHDNAKGPHMLWTPDGQHVAVDRLWTEFELASVNGKLIANLSPQTVRSREIGPFGKGDLNYASVFYGSYSPDGSLIAIATRPDSDEGGKIWLMDRASGKVRYLCRALSFGPVTQGQPRLGFFNGNAGIAFSTDKSWGTLASAPPQIYTITGFERP
jgi:hypothetical protein